jgi:hypothetical protein
MSGRHERADVAPLLSLKPGRVATVHRTYTVILHFAVGIPISQLTFYLQAGGSAVSFLYFNEQ